MNQNNNETEASPLLPNVATRSPKPYYFLSGRKRESFIEEEASINLLPAGTTEDEFASRPVVSVCSQSIQQQNRRSSQQPNLFQRIFQGERRRPRQTRKINKAAIKVEPKVFFASERTFLAWLHTSVLLAGASIAITSLSENNLLNQLCGILLLPIAIAFLCYSMHQYGKRAEMIKMSAPGPYEDIVGPSILAIVLIFSIIAQFSIKLYSIM